jgi:hypothetical protein
MRDGFDEFAFVTRFLFGMDLMSLRWILVSYLVWCISSTIPSSINLHDFVVQSIF